MTTKIMAIDAAKEDTRLSYFNIYLFWDMKQDATYIYKTKDYIV